MSPLLEMYERDGRVEAKRKTEWIKLVSSKDKRNRESKIILVGLFPEYFFPPPNKCLFSANKR